MLGVPVTDSASPSGSDTKLESNKSVSKEAASSVLLSVISLTTGASLTPLMVTVTFCVSLTVPSVKVIIQVSV